MRYEEILNILAPCGLNCRKCMANVDGEIRQYSLKLKELLGPNFDQYADRFKGFMPVFENYSRFKELLEFFTQAECTGCRNGACRYPACGVMKCFSGKGVDFCFQCSEFPCDKSNFDPGLKQRWIEMNTRMKEIGVEAFFEETKDQGRYR